MNNNRTKKINGKKPYYYQDIIYYIKNENKDTKTLPNPTPKNIYQKIIQEGSKQHTIAGKTYGKTPTHNRILANIEKYFNMLRATIL